MEEVYPASWSYAFSLIFTIKSYRDLSRNVMVTWLRNSSGAKIFVINEILFLSRKKYPNGMSNGLVLDFAPLVVRMWGNLSHSSPVNRIIKITHAYNLQVKMLDFVPFTIRT